MRRTVLLCVIGGAAAFASGGTAIAGAGCHTDATQAHETGKDVATVRMIDACFKASLTTVDPGTAVTFVNDDWATHNVGGNAWGTFEDMKEGDAFTATFADPGIYPFACSYHPGMTGAIVVGDGTGAGNGEDVWIRPFEPDPEAVSRAATERDGIPAGGVLAIGLAGLGLGAAIVIGISRIAKTQPRS